ncbi:MULTISPECIES: GlcG/HbpS family heme-binding protein [Xanthobacter]|uniref:GlcG/HbpS family heme-binding protein n=1 Tax=Xanthobacter TaxID=279 RepID=UPI001F174581|nr:MULTISPECIES: heme-binding protein [unclassified Xanthobacter]
MPASAANLTLETAQVIITAALVHARTQEMNPLAVCVLDARGALKAFSAEDGTSLKRGDIAMGKANGALSLGMGSRSLFRRAQDQPFFISAATAAIGGSLIPVPGGVLVRDGEGRVIGAVGISGDTSDNDEAAALAGIASAGFVADPGTD